VRGKPPILFALSFALLLAATPSARVARARSASGPTLLKRTVVVSARRFLRYWPNPRAAEPQYNTWSWTPQVSFQFLGPVAGGSQLVFEASTPDGKPWVSFKLPTQEAGDDELVTVKGPDMDESELEKMAVTKTGLFPFKISLKNALAGSTDTLFAGKFRVATYAPDQAIPEYRGKQEFYVVQDWRLPVGFIWYDPTVDEKVPVLGVQMWFRGTHTGQKMQAVLLYKGQQVGDVMGNNEQEVATGVADPEGRWGLWTFQFLKVRGYNQDTESAATYPETFFLDKHPGDYEIKVLRDQKLARSATFTVGADGRIVDNGIARQNQLGGIRMVLPVKVVGDADVKYDAASWKSDMLYGNALGGFTAP
jgi:hypothetical protein